MRAQVLGEVPAIEPALDVTEQRKQNVPAHPYLFITSSAFSISGEGSLMVMILPEGAQPMVRVESGLRGFLVPGML